MSVVVLMLIFASPFAVVYGYRAGVRAADKRGAGIEP